MFRRPPRSTLFPYTTLFRSLKPLHERKVSADQIIGRLRGKLAHVPGANLFLQSVQDLRIGGRASNAQFQYTLQDRKSTRLNSSHVKISYAVFCLKKKKHIKI